MVTAFFRELIGTICAVIYNYTRIIGQRYRLPIKVYDRNILLCTHGFIISLLFFDRLFPSLTCYGYTGRARPSSLVDFPSSVVFIITIFLFFYFFFIIT